MDKRPNLNDHTVKEVNAVLNQSLPQRVLADYDYWHKRERELEILVWYKNQKVLYGGLVLLYKIVKNLRRMIA